MPLLFILLMGLGLSTSVRAGEKSLYDFLWLDPDKQVYVLQNKIYQKKNSIYVDVGYISNISSKFQDTNGLQLKGGYYFTEEFALEFNFQNYSNSNNDDYRNVRLINSAEPFIRRFKSTQGIYAIWSPFYGKINTFNKIFYFDWSFGLGYQHINAESNIDNVRNPLLDSKFKSESYSGVGAKTNIKFHINQHMHLGFEYQNTYYRAAGPKNPKSKKMKTNTDLIFSVGFSY
ncbi:MAG TPA: outer membrane beta-barrel domain-containing protein [Bacteriovoracaceae bacterium]|nr:outer membrane beta-barrel domain-containing protein [Bacteriovoracaceae bacterium]